MRKKFETSKINGGKLQGVEVISEEYTVDDLFSCLRKAEPTLILRLGNMWKNGNTTGDVKIYEVVDFYVNT